MSTAPCSRFDPSDSLPLICGSHCRSGRAFDLAVSLEVAEHLPAECAATFVGDTHKLGSCCPVLRRDSVSGRHPSRQRAVAGLLGESVQAARTMRSLTAFVTGSGTTTAWNGGTRRTSSCSRVPPRSRVIRAFGRSASALCSSRLSLVHPRKYLEALHWMRGIRSRLPTPSKSSYPGTRASFSLMTTS